MRSIVAGCAMLGAAALLGAGPAGAQESLGELLDRGAVKMTRAELVAALQNTVMSGDSLRRQGGGIRFEYAPDGTVTGVFRNENGEVRHAGIWRVEDSGLFVRETTVTPGGDRRTEAASSTGWATPTTRPSRPTSATPRCSSACSNGGSEPPAPGFGDNRQDAKDATAWTPGSSPGVT